MRPFHFRASLLLPLLGLLARSGLAASTPAERMNGLMITGIELPAQTMETPASQISAYGDNAVQHCYVFSSFAAFETDTGQVGAESIMVRKREEGQSIADLCKMPRRAGDHVLTDADGYVLGARGPYLFVTSADSFGTQGGLAVFQISTGKKLLNFERNIGKPLTAQFEDGILALHFFMGMTLDCDLTVESCWLDTLRKNHVPPDVVLVRPSCPDQANNPRAILLSTPVNVADVTRGKIAFENSQPVCDRAP